MPTFAQVYPVTSIPSGQWSFMSAAVLFGHNVHFNDTALQQFVTNYLEAKEIYTVTLAHTIAMMTPLRDFQDNEDRKILSIANDL